MEIVVNGEARSVAATLSIAELVAECGAAGRRIAVEINEQIVPRSAYAVTHLSSGDRVEIVGAIGGG